MRAAICLAVFSTFTIWAQDQSPQNPPANQNSQPNQTASLNAQGTAAGQSPATNQSATTTTQSTTTQTTTSPMTGEAVTSFKGTLVDAACGGGAPSATAPTSATTPTASSTDTKAGAGSAGGCSPSASTTQFALKMKDGRVVRFDSVGNVRMQEALKNKKKWSDALSAGKPIQVRVDGAMNGDTLTVVSVS